MDYYMPTTLKLVNAYREFDALEVKGENITNAMQEIENTLDTISLAFEKLLDDLFGMLRLMCQRIFQFCR